MSQELHQIEVEVKRQRRKRNRYNKIPLKIKLVFYRKVIHEAANFAAIAKQLGLNYSTAKTLIRNYRAVPEEQNQELMTRLLNSFDQMDPHQLRSSYRQIRPEKHSLQLTSQSDDKPESMLLAESPQIEIICNHIQS